MRARDVRVYPVYVGQVYGLTRVQLGLVPEYVPCHMSLKRGLHLLGL